MQISAGVESTLPEGGRRTLIALIVLLLSISIVPQRAAARPGTSSVAVSDILAIDAGGPGIANWRADVGSPAYTLRSKTAVSTTGIRDPAPQEVYGSQRFFSGPLVYSLAGLKPGTAYRVRLHFAELVDNARGDRIFNIAINGQRTCTKFDVFAAAGGKFHAVIENYAATANSAGEIRIELTPVHGDAIINGVEVRRSTALRFAVLDKARR